MRRTLVAVAAVALFSLTAASAGAQVERWGSYYGDTSYRQLVPTIVPGLEGTLEVAASNASTYALRSDGTVWAWGNGDDGELGNGGTADSPIEPVQVQLPAGVHAVAIGEAKDEGFAIDSTGQGWAWGRNEAESLCLGQSGVQLTPMKVSGMTNAAEVRGGGRHVLWRLKDGTVAVCGTNSVGQLGLGPSARQRSTPTVVPGLSGISQISSGGDTSAARTSSGSVYMWGENADGEIGIGSTEPAIYEPALVSLPGPAEQISAGGSNLFNPFSLALVGGQVYGWGADRSGQVGDGAKADKLSPVATGLHFAKIAAGGAYALAIDAQGGVWAWGSGDGGELGTGSGGIRLTPTLIDTGASMVSATANDSVELGS